MMLFIPVALHAQERSMQDLAKALENEVRTLNNAGGDKKAIAHANGNIGRIFVDIAKLPAESIQPGTLVSADKKVDLNTAIEYSKKAIEQSEDIGDMEQLKAAYQNLYAAQKMAGKVKDAVGTYAKIQSLKHAILNPKKAKEIELKQLEYEHKKREDSIRREQQLAEEKVKQQKEILSQQQQQLEASKATLTNAQKEKEHVNKQLQQTQTDLTNEKTNSEEKTKQLTLAEQEKALQAANLELQKNKLQLQQNELELKDQALEQKRRIQYLYIAGLVVLVAFSALIFRNFNAQKKFNAALMIEKKRSEELLLNILPEEVAAELMNKGFADAKHFYDVTVLFTDFVNFTSVSETMSPQQLVGELHICFKAFDMILGKYRIEKIKTVGDAYMAVSGLPLANANHAGDICAAAIEIRDFMANRKKELGNETFAVRVGINSGNVVAGIVGLRKFAYDIWGDAVNIAARMEQNSEPGKINISDTTYQLVKDKYACVYRGKIEAKNKGGIDMYYLN